MQCTAYMTYTGDTFWVTPRVPTQVMSLGTTPRNTYDWDTIYLRRSNLNLSATVGSSGITAAQTFDADRVFAGSAAN